MQKGKLIICVDFDGVIHDYMHGWRDGTIYGNVTKGFFEWYYEARNSFNIVIYSSRSKTDASINAMREWIQNQEMKHLEQLYPDSKDFAGSQFEFANEKPPAWLTIDDRGLTFNGNWDDFAVKKLQDFKPWNVRGIN